MQSYAQICRSEKISTMNAHLIDSWGCNDDWILHLVKSGDFVCASTSNGSIHLFDSNKQSLSGGPLSTIHAHNQSLKSLRGTDDPNVIASCGSEAVKVWDLRIFNEGPTHTFNNKRNGGFLSLDSKFGMVAAGSEKEGSDACIDLWDLRSSAPVRSFVDSHFDDVTEIRFHPVDKNILLSGSTDGYVNIYDLSVPDEDEALHQVINFASIHSANFLSPNRIFALSHIETLAFYELNDKSDDAVEPKPVDIGDMRPILNCEYVVDIYPEYVACGSNSSAELKVFPLNPSTESIATNAPIYFPGAHGEEVVRAVHLDSPKTAYTAGEDGIIKLWELPQAQQEEKLHKKEKSHKSKSKKSKHGKRYNPY